MCCEYWNIFVVIYIRWFFCCIIVCVGIGFGEDGKKIYVWLGWDSCFVWVNWDFSWFVCREWVFGEGGKNWWVIWFGELFCLGLLRICL